MKFNIERAFLWSFSSFYVHPRRLSNLFPLLGYIEQNGVLLNDSRTVFNMYTLSSFALQRVYFMESMKHNLWLSSLHLAVRLLLFLQFIIYTIFLPNWNKTKLQFVSVRKSCVPPRRVAFYFVVFYFLLLVVFSLNLSWFMRNRINAQCASVGGVFSFYHYTGLFSFYLTFGHDFNSFLFSLAAPNRKLNQMRRASLQFAHIHTH